MYSSIQELQLKATSFLKTCYDELGLTDKLDERLNAVQKEIDETGTYFHTPKN